MSKRFRKYSLLTSFLLLSFVPVSLSQVPQVNHVLIVLEENTNFSDVIGNPVRPYLNSLRNRFGLATYYFANTHPSIGNYFMRPGKSSPVTTPSAAQYPWTTSSVSCWRRERLERPTRKTCPLAANSLRRGQEKRTMREGLNRMSRLRSRAAFAFCLLLVLSKTPVHAAQDKPNKGDTEDKTLFLVARPELGDPIFKESVVLMFPSSVVAGAGLVVGLIVNRPARVALSEIFPNDNALKNGSETAYFGGPVDPRVPGVVFRSSKAVKQATLLFGDVYVSFDPDFIKELLTKPQRTPDLHLFVGRSQWAPAQLQNEMVKGAWYSVRAETNLIFSASPQSLWRKLYERAEPPKVARAPDVPFRLSANLTVGVRQVENRLATTYPR